MVVPRDIELHGQLELLDSRKLLEGESFWDNRDWDWYEVNIPFFECPDRELQTTYYYRWELLTKHLTYGSPNSGYSFTEFIDRPFWSGAYGAISCPAGHQLYEARWLRDPRYAKDYAAYWLNTPGAQPRNYSTWLGDATWAVQRVHPDDPWLVQLLPGLQANYAGWEQRHYVADVGLFWQTGHDDGMEYNINSRQTTDIVRGAPGFRPTLNSYLYADALAISRIADLTGDAELAEEFRQKAASLRSLVQEKLWDPQRQFFYHLAMRDETADGATVEAGTWTYQTGRHAGSAFGRELIGFVPWQFSLPAADRGYEVAWRKLVDPEAFAAPFGPRTVELHDPLFALKPTCCWWSGQSWPYATSQTLKALANLLQEYRQQVVTPKDYFKLLQTFSQTHRKDGRPYLAEACHPETGSFAGHDSYNHSEHYFHSSFNDLVITGLVGLRPRDDEVLEIHPLAPPSWNYFALDRVPYRGRTLSILWDRDGSRYGRGGGFRIFADGDEVAHSESVRPIQVALPKKLVASRSRMSRVNFAVSNEGNFYPRVSTSHKSKSEALAKLIDGNYWYHSDPPNRWTFEGSPNATDHLTIEFGIEREVDTVRLYFLDDREGVIPPSHVEIDVWREGQWRPVESVRMNPDQPVGHLANTVSFERCATSQLRVRFKHSNGGRSGLTEIECWGSTDLPVTDPPHPAGNVAINRGEQFPAASASFSDRFGGKPGLAIDGKINYLPAPLNRWTSYQSPNESDWLEVDFGKTEPVNRVELAIYDDRGGVQKPRQIRLEFSNGSNWTAISDATYTPDQPVGGQLNVITFKRIEARKIRVVFEHAPPAKSGISEIMIWNDRDR